MPTTPSRADALAQQLLDAQVAHHLARLRSDILSVTVAALADDLFAAAGAHTLDVLVDRDAIKAIVTRALVTVPASAAVSGIVELAVGVVHDGPAEPFPLGELVDREQLERLLDEALALTPALERTLERLTASPLVGAMVSRFMGRVVGEVLQANQAVADKVPGLGSLMSFGTSAASRMMGAADKQLDGALGGAAGKGGTFAVRRMNRIVVETLRDPTTREAVLQVWDLAAQEQVSGADPAGSGVTREEAAGLVDATHDLVISTLAGEHVVRLGDAVVDAFFDRFGGYTPTEMLDELDLDRADLIADLVRLAPRVVEAMLESGDLERVVRAQLAPFYASAEVRAILE